MGGDLILAVLLGVAIVGLVATIPFVRVRLELARLRDRYELTDEELEAYVREFPQICHAVEVSMDPGTSAREIRRIARESAIAAILRQRSLRRVGPQVEVELGVEAPTAKRELSLHGPRATVKVEDLRRSTNGRDSAGD